jgi:cytochrome c553
MKIRKLCNHAAIAAASLLALASSAFAQKRWDAPRIVTENCAGCHGIDGNSQLPYIPRLAGLNTVYFEQKIAEFRAAAATPVDQLFYLIILRRPAKTAMRSTPEAQVNMVGIGQAISTEEIKASAAWYAAQRPASGRFGNKALIERGKDLYMNGLPARGVAACRTCHGPQAQGIATTPRLAGQNAGYTVSQLAKFRAGDRQHASVMTAVAQHLDSEEASAAAAYLQSQYARNQLIQEK